MRKPGPYLRFAVVANAILLVGGFIGCQSGAFNWLSDTGDATKPASAPAASAPVQQVSSPAAKYPATVPPGANANPEPTFMPSTKAVFPPSMRGLVTDLTPAETFQPAPQDTKKDGPALGAPIPQTPPGNMP